MALRVHETQLAADQLKIAFYDAGVRDLDGLETSFAALSERPPEALVVTVELFTPPPSSAKGPLSARKPKTAPRPGEVLG